MTKFQPGDQVHYVPFVGCNPKLYQKGIVKSISDDRHLFVVYNCAEEWDRYKEYTAARTSIEQLRSGWPE